MVLGSIGIILIFIGIFEFLKVVEIFKALILIMLGLAILVRYIYHLEEKAGLSKKIITIKAVIIIIIVLSIFTYFY